jgi:LysM repeat protein
MTIKKDQYKEATSFFGTERMAQLESVLKEQSKKNKKQLYTNKMFWHLKVISITSLLVYSFSATAFIINNRVVRKQNPEIASTPTLKPDVKATLIKIDPIKTNNLPKQETIVKIKVKKGDSLSSIAERIIKSNGLKNTYENREVVMGELISKNSNLQEKQSVKYGWTLMSLSQSEVKQICNN